LRAAGFITEQYHANVPTFGEWGWTIGTVMGSSALARITTTAEQPLVVPSQWLSREQILAAFVFSPSYFSDASTIKINTLGSHRLYQYHQRAWKQRDGVFFTSESTDKKQLAKSHNMAYIETRKP